MTKIQGYFFKYVHPIFNLVLDLNLSTFFTYYLKPSKLNLNEKNIFTIFYRCVF